MNQDFEYQAQAALDQLEAELESAGADFEQKGDGLIEILLDDDSKVIVNRHSAAREIWVAARSGAFHYRWDGGRWRNTRDGSELFESIRKLLAAPGG